MKIDDKLSEVFDVEVTEKSGDLVVPAPIEPAEKAAGVIEADYESTRNNLNTLLITGENALLHALEVAKSSEHPRAFEVVGNLIKQLADVNQQLMALHQQKQKLDGVDGKADGGKQVTNNNAIFVGSTAELNKMIAKLNKGE